MHVFIGGYLFSPASPRFGFVPWGYPLLVFRVVRPRRPHVKNAYFAPTIWIRAQLDLASFIAFRNAECSGRLAADVVGTCAFEWDVECEFDEDGDGEIDGRIFLVGRVVKNLEGRFVGEEIQRAVGGVTDCESRYVVVMTPFED